MRAQLPASFFAYRKQQHRWTCGPVQLWRRAAVDIWASALPMSAKLELIVAYFGIRKFATHWVSLGFFCTLVPLSMFTPEVSTFVQAICLLHVTPLDEFCCLLQLLAMPDKTLGAAHPCCDPDCMVARTLNISCMAPLTAGQHPAVGVGAPAGRGYSHHSHVHAQGKLSPDGVPCCDGSLAAQIHARHWRQGSHLPSSSELWQCSSLQHTASEMDCVCVCRGGCTAYCMCCLRMP